MYILGKQSMFQMSKYILQPNFRFKQWIKEQSLYFSLITTGPFRNLSKARIYFFFVFDIRYIEKSSMIRWIHHFFWSKNFSYISLFWRRKFWRRKIFGKIIKKTNCVKTKWNHGRELVTNEFMPNFFITGKYIILKEFNKINLK